MFFFFRVRRIMQVVGVLRRCMYVDYVRTRSADNGRPAVYRNHRSRTYPDIPPRLTVLFLV